MENHSLPRALILELLLAPLFVMSARAADSPPAIDAVAERYVRLQLAIGVRLPPGAGID